METARNLVMVRDGNFGDPAMASSAPSETPMDLTKHSRDEPQDLRVRVNGSRNPTAGPHHKRERLEEMVNHIRRCSTISRQPIVSPKTQLDGFRGTGIQANGTDSGSDSETSDNGNSWRPEDIFILTADAAKVQDLSVRRTKSPPNHINHINHINHEAQVSSNDKPEIRWNPRLHPTWQSAYLPWMAYYAHLIHQGTVHQEDSSVTAEEEDRTATPTPPLAPVASSSSGRKRAPRALTGKHVKHGTGASPSTLMSLRQKIEQRQKKTRESKVKLHKKS